MTRLSQDLSVPSSLSSVATTHLLEDPSEGQAGW